MKVRDALWGHCTDRGEGDSSRVVYIVLERTVLNVKDWEKVEPRAWILPLGFLVAVQFFCHGIQPGHNKMLGCGKNSLFLCW